MTIMLQVRRERWQRTSTAVEVAHLRYKRALSFGASGFEVRELWDAYIIAQREEAKAWRTYEATMPEDEEAS